MIIYHINKLTQKKLHESAPGNESPKENTDTQGCDDQRPDNAIIPGLIIIRTPAMDPVDDYPAGESLVLGASSIGHMAQAIERRLQVRVSGLGPPLERHAVRSQVAL